MRGVEKHWGKKETDLIGIEEGVERLRKNRRRGGKLRKVEGG
jgi:hypothetical protein